MEKPVKYLLIFLLGLAVILGASGFSFVVHHCFTSDHTEITLKSGHTDNCCHHPDHEKIPIGDNCCTPEGEEEESKPPEEFRHTCCEEGSLSITLQPVITKNTSSEIYQNLEEVTISETLISQGSSNNFRPNLLFYPPPSLSGRQILLVNQIFLL
jgi:hypothetical protein